MEIYFTYVISREQKNTPNKLWIGTRRNDTSVDFIVKIDNVAAFVVDRKYAY